MAQRSRTYKTKGCTKRRVLVVPSTPQERRRVSKKQRAEERSERAYERSVPDDPTERLAPAELESGALVAARSPLRVRVRVRVRVRFRVAWGSSGTLRLVSALVVFCAACVAGILACASAA